ncbi:hypothetical protein CAOG_002294 [Capsaspora owczarzaki ATCC 30864]|uniref:Uncharacterized protein n=1 Tax=Capsaspora owczarzaki (strain ATCC 30864) TaxID=595528 RepID=A0A0D2VLZ7_CAPO3|nr:hypothetical protein CAOG_002294 [Capsaspora owczarzaki ATCC 30864]
MDNLNATDFRMDLPCRQQQKQQQQQQCACLLSVRGGRGSILNAWHSDSFIGSAAPFGTFGSSLPPCRARL